MADTVLSVKVVVQHCALIFEREWEGALRGFRCQVSGLNDNKSKIFTYRPSLNLIRNQAKL